MSRIFLSSIPLLVFLIVFLYKKIKVNNIVHLIFCGVISVSLSLVLSQIFIKVLSLLKFLSGYGIGFYRIIYYLIIVGGVEELSRYIALKLSKPKTKNQIFINLLLISLIFIIIENYGYIGIANNPLKLGIYRSLFPNHMFFSVIMSYFLCLSFEKRKDGQKVNIFDILAIVVSMFFHGLFDYSLDVFGINTNNVNFILVALFVFLGYIIPMLLLFKLKNDKEEVVKFNKILNIIELILICFFLIFILFVFGVI